MNDEILYTYQLLIIALAARSPHASSLLIIANAYYTYGPSTRLVFHAVSVYREEVSAILVPVNSEETDRER